MSLVRRTVPILMAATPGQDINWPWGTVESWLVRERLAGRVFDRLTRTRF